MTRSPLLPACGSGIDAGTLDHELELERVCGTQDRAGYAADPSSQFPAACRKSTVTSPPSAKQNPPVSPAANSQGYTTVTVSQLAGMLPAKNFTMINVHVPYQGDIPQTDLDIPFDRIAENLDKLPAKDAPVLIYCRSGRMSTEATLTLTALGYNHVMHLEGGFLAWEAAGNKMVKRP